MQTIDYIEKSSQFKFNPHFFALVSASLGPGAAERYRTWIAR